MNIDQHRFQGAVSFAARAHTGQLRKDGQTPYAAHPFRVAMIVRHLFDCGDENAMIAALLHDTIEDTTTDFDELEEKFGIEAAKLVAALTKDARLPEEEREAAYDDGLRQAVPIARLIKLADVFDNLCDCIPAASPERIIAKAERALALAIDDGPEFDRARSLVREKIDSMRQSPS